MIRRLLLWIILIVGLWIAISRFTELQHLLSTLSGGRWQWILVAVGIQVCYYTAFASLYQVAFSLVGVQARLKDVLPVLLASIFVNVAAPTGGTAGNALFIDDAAQRGQSSTRAAVGTLLALLADYGVFALILLVGLIYLFFTHTLQTYELVTAAILWLLVALMAGIVWLGFRQPAQLARLLGWGERTTNELSERIARRPLLRDGWAAETTQEFTLASDALRARPQGVFHLLLVSFLAHALDIATIYALFLAFLGPVGLGPLVAGYAMGVLFWIVSITPQGIGIVEGVMALVFTSLGLASGPATVVALAFRGLSFWLPLLIGFFVLRRLRTFAPQRQVQQEVWSVRLAALGVAAIGLINLISAVMPGLSSRLQFLAEYIPIEAVNGARLASAVLGFVLVVLSTHLWRRKRLAWLLATGMLTFSAAGHLLKGLDFEEAALALFGVVWLWSARHHFHARSDAPSIWHGMRLLAGSALFTLAYGALGFYLLDRHYRVNYDLWGAVRQTVVMFTQFYDPGLHPVTGFGLYFANSIYGIGGATALYALFALLRPVVVRGGAKASERATAQTVIEKYGRSSLARLLLLPDKVYFVASASIIGHVVKGRGALALGDPVGPAEDIPAAIAAFQNLCAQNDWTPAFFQVLPDYLPTYEQAGLDVLCLGHEAIVDLQTFSLEGRSNKHLRNAVNRLTRQGYGAVLHEAPHSDELLQQLRQVSDAWLTMAHGREKRFSLGWFDEEYLSTCPVMAIHNEDGEITSFANILTEYQANEVTLDLMRRLPEVENGTMDFLFLSLFQWAKEQGYAGFNLGMSPLAGVGEQSDDPALERAIHFIYENLNQFYNFKGLHEFKEKFNPTWSPRYLIYPGPARLMTIAYALNRASAGDRFVIDTLQDMMALASRRLRAAWPRRGDRYQPQKGAE
ncbi:MAG: bifunctional lysylphosphatidylglycerol flippase/synthetase MprF [Caldilineaceae bacterium]|nr:bifunctional lysylphosphatidylglycerol flippase/synthetase MprF [Caldilineaceae bacterium]